MRSDRCVSPVRACAHACVIGMCLWRTSSCRKAASVQLLLVLLSDCSLHSAATKFTAARASIGCLTCKSPCGYEYMCLKFRPAVTGENSMLHPMHQNMQLCE